MTNTSWQTQFSSYFKDAVAAYREGATSAEKLVDKPTSQFLAGLGCSAQEFFDFVEDEAKSGEPGLEAVLAMTAVRYDYFEREQQAVPSHRQIAMASLPPKTEAVEGIEWLPRILAKAEAKLRGEMPADLMYGCGGDRRFFTSHGIDGAEFLRRVWAANGDRASVVSWVKSRSTR